MLTPLPCAPQAAQLGIQNQLELFSSQTGRCESLRDIITDISLWKECRKKSRIESVTADKFLTHDLLIRWCMLYLCAIEAAQNFFAFK